MMALPPRGEWVYVDEVVGSRSSLTSESICAAPLAGGRCVRAQLRQVPALVIRPLIAGRT
jgi:hypothetical protein